MSEETLSEALAKLDSDVESRKKSKKKMQLLSFLKRKLKNLHLSQKMLFKKTLILQINLAKKNFLRLK